MFASEVIPAILFLIFLFLVPETPRYLVMRGKTSAASVILHKLLDRQEAEKELADIQESFKEKAPSLRPYFKFMGAWLLTFVILFAALELLGNTNALELALIFSFVISLIFPIHSLS